MQVLRLRTPYEIASVQADVRERRLRSAAALLCQTLSLANAGPVAAMLSRQRKTAPVALGVELGRQAVAVDAAFPTGLQLFLGSTGVRAAGDFQHMGLQVGYVALACGAPCFSSLRYSDIERIEVWRLCDQIARLSRVRTLAVGTPAEIAEGKRRTVAVEEPRMQSSAGATPRFVRR